jgi:hypothetical protein
VSSFMKTARYLRVLKELWGGGGCSSLDSDSFRKN